MSRYQDWCFTVNNHTFRPTDFPHYTEYVVYGYEVGESGTPHLQGFIQFARRTRLSVVQKIFKNKCHCEPRMGTPEEAATYCKKDGNFFEHGTLQPRDKNQGKRSDLDVLAQAARQGVPATELFDLHPASYVRYNKSLMQLRYIDIVDPPPNYREIEVHVYYGPPGTGKTRQAYQDDPQLYATPVSGNGNVWYDGYTGQKTILMDDYSGQLPLVQLLRVLDVYPIQVPTKGNHVWLHNTRLVITTNTHPRNWYDFSMRQSSWDALCRRITKFVLFFANDNQADGDLLDLSTH